MFFAFPYRKEPFPPFWGPQTSNANFCEEDYIVTTYVAEFINTLTNLIYVIYGVHGVRRVIRQRLDFVQSLPYIGLIGVGVCSGFFHCTLKYHSQMCDDLSMFFATALVLYRVLTYQSPPRTAAIIAVCLTTTLLIISAVHVIYDEKIIHYVTFISMVQVVGYMTIRLVSGRVQDDRIKRKVYSIAKRGACFFAAAYVLWLTDQYACGPLTKAKRAIGMPWAFILEFHGWWHIFTGLGSYVYMVLVEYLTSEGAGKDPQGLFVWPAGWVVEDKLVGTVPTYETFHDE